MSADRRRSIANDATTETELNCDYIGAATSAAAATKDRPRQNSLYSDVLCATLCLRVCVCVCVSAYAVQGGHEKALASQSTDYRQTEIYSRK